MTRLANKLAELCFEANWDVFELGPVALSNSCWESDSQDLLPDVKRVKARSNQLYPRLVRTSVSSTRKVPDSSSSTWNPWNHWLKLLSNSCFDAAVGWYLIPMRFEFLLGADRIWLYCSSAVCLTVLLEVLIELAPAVLMLLFEIETRTHDTIHTARTYVHAHTLHIAKQLGLLL